MGSVSIGQATDILSENFAPWVQDLSFKVTDIGTDFVVIELPHQDRLCRIGGMICGQALISAADTAMVVAVCCGLGGFKPMGTVDLTASFMRPISGEGARLHARIMRMGRTMAFCSTEISGCESSKQSAFATGTYALPT